MQSLNMFKLVCNDGKEVEIDSKSCEKSGMLQRLIPELVSSKIPLLNDEVDEKICLAIVEYLVHYKDVPLEEIKEIRKPICRTEMKDITQGDIWAADFIDNFSPLDLVTLANSASFFEIPSLSSLAISKMVTIFNQNQDDVHKLREIFNIKENMDTQQLEDWNDAKDKNISSYEQLIRENLEVIYPYTEEHCINEETN